MWVVCQQKTGPLRRLSVTVSVSLLSLLLSLCRAVPNVSFSHCLVPSRSFPASGTFHHSLLLTFTLLLSFSCLAMSYLLALSLSAYFPLSCFRSLSIKFCCELSVLVIVEFLEAYVYPSPCHSPAMNFGFVIEVGTGVMLRMLFRSLSPQG